MNSGIDRRTRVVELLARAFVICFGLFCLYVVIDMWGTMHHYWRGNFFSIALSDALEHYAPLGFDAVRSFFMSYGLGDHDATLVTGITIGSICMSIAFWILFTMLWKDIPALAKWYRGEHKKS